MCDPDQNSLTPPRRFLRLPYMPPGNPRCRTEARQGMARRGREKTGGAAFGPPLIFLSSSGAMVLVECLAHRKLVK